MKRPLFLITIALALTVPSPIRAHEGHGPHDHKEHAKHGSHDDHDHGHSHEEHGEHGPHEEANRVILDANAVRNLRLEVSKAEKSDFEETLFALGRIEALPRHVASVTSRIPGRVAALNTAPGEWVEAEAEVLKVESRQPGTPPPVIPLHAPLSGLVTRLETRLGDPVTPDAALLEITNLSEVYVVARIPEHEAGRLQPDTEALISVAAFPDTPFRGRFLRFAPSADRQSGTIDALFTLRNPAGTLRPHMRAELSIILNKRPEVLSIPRAALQGTRGQRFVYIKDPELPHAFRKMEVEVGSNNGRFIEILHGITPEHEVVTRGAYSLAFAGAGSVSLKEALDAAHGHEHAEDGSELDSHAGATGHHHEDEGHSGGTSPIWKYLSGALFLLLAASIAQRRLPRTQLRTSSPL